MNKKYLVIGSSGYLGQQVMRQLGCQGIATHHSRAKFPNSLFYDFYQDGILPVDPTDKVVIFAAAVEMNQSLERLEASMKQLLNQVSNSRFIYISSDALFNGDKGEYTEDEEPMPINAYGHNLVMCEKIIQEMVIDSCIIRPSYIYGVGNGQLDSRLSRTRDKLLGGETCTAYVDYYKSPLSVHEVADAVVYLADSNYQGSIHVAGPRMSAYEFHQRAMNALKIDASGLLQEYMPRRVDLMQDTSLNSSRWWSMRGARPLSIEEAFEFQEEQT